MAERRMKILMYVPVIWPDDSGAKLVALAHDLAAVAAECGDELTILATPMDLLGGPVVWPHAPTKLARVLPPIKLEPLGMPEAARDAFQQFSDLADRHDVALIPQAFGAVPSECRLKLSIPVILGIPHLDFDSTDAGARTDRYRREMDRLVRFAEHFVFPTESLRERACERYAIPFARSSVVRATGSAVFPSPETVRSLGLPKRYLLSAGWNRPRQECDGTAEAIAWLFQRGELPCPFVGLTEGIDARPLASLEQLDYAKSRRAILHDAGMKLGRDWFELERPEPRELHAIVAGATAILGNGPRGTGPDWLTLTAERTGVPAINPRADGYEAEFTFDSTSSDALASAIFARFESEPASARSAAVPGRDSARQLLSLLGQLIGDRCPISHPIARPPKPRDQRVAWLISHTTLRDAEVPILRELGYEVYTNKVLPTGEDYRSGSADYSWDDDSTLPTDVLTAMNEFNFYQHDLTHEMESVLNAYFGTIFCATYGLLVRQLTKCFRGRILIRAFGLEAPRSYGEYLGHFAEGWMWKRLWENQNRFWLSACYEQIPPFEPAFLRDRSVILPVAMPERTFRATDRWIGSDPRIFFVCPSIRLSSPDYYGQIYRRFKSAFGDLPHAIGGAQPIPVDDPSVAGYLTEDQFTAALIDLRVLYYHSREPRHIHYHPLEAIAIGMPVVYLNGGLMEFFDTGNRAGGCDTEGEARAKLERILAGDSELVEAIRQGQRTILTAFTIEFNRNEWRRLFHGGVMDESCIPDLPTPKPGSLPALPAAEIRPGTPGLAVRMLTRSDFQFPHEDPPDGAIVPVRLGKKQRIREWIPEPLRPPARAVFRTLRFVKHRIRAVGSPTPPAVLPAGDPELPAPAVDDTDGRYLTDPPASPPPRPLPSLTELNHGLGEIARVVSDREWSFYLDPVGVLNPNLEESTLPRTRLIVGFTHLAWETEDAYEILSQAACREAMLWCRLAAHAIFPSERHRELAVRRYGLDPRRTSVLPPLTLMGGIPASPPPKFKHTGKKFPLPESYLIGYQSKYTNPNSWLLLEGLKILDRRKAKIPPLLLTEIRAGREAGRSSLRVETHAAKTLFNLGLVRGTDVVLLPPLRESRRWALEARARLSVVVPRWGGWGVRDVTRAALARVPVIASAIGPIADAYGESGDNVLLVDPDDAVGLANAIQRTLELTGETSARAERAYATANRLNSPEALGERERLFAAIAATN